MHVQIIVDFMSSKKKMTPLLSFRTTAILQETCYEFFFKKKSCLPQTHILANLETWRCGQLGEITFCLAFNYLSCKITIGQKYENNMATNERCLIVMVCWNFHQAIKPY